MNFLGKRCFTVICICTGISSGASQSSVTDQSEKFKNYYQKPMRTLDVQLMDEVLENTPADIKDIIETINDINKKESVRLLLVGDPGVGKTTLAQAIAMQTNRPCFIIRAPSLANQYQFSGEQNLISAISPLFDINEPCIVIIDEIDALKQYKGDRNNQDASPANTLCNLLDDAEDHPNIVFIATTNKLKQLPEDLKSRFSAIITLQLPDKIARERIILYHLDQLKKSYPAIEIDEATIKLLAAKTAGFSARELKAMVIKCKTYMRNVDVETSITPKQIWQAYEDEKPLIGSGYHIKVRLKELADNHGVALSTFAISTMLGIIGISLSEHRSAQGMRQSHQQYSEQLEIQRMNRKKEKCTKLIKEIIAHEKLLQDPKINGNSYELNHAVITLRILRFKLLQRVAAPGSKDEYYFKELIKSEKKVLTQIEKIKNHDLNQKSVKELNDELAQLYDNFVKKICSDFQIKSAELEQYCQSLNEKYDPEITAMIALERSTENATEINTDNERSKAAERERKESLWDRLKVGAFCAGVGAVCGFILTFIMGDKTSLETAPKITFKPFIDH